MRWLQQQMGVSPGPMQCLAELPAIRIKEKASAVEAATAIAGQEVEMANRYKVYALHGHDDLFYAKEKTNFLGRQFKQCFSSCAPWNVDVMYSQGIGKEPAFFLEREASCNCCCFGRSVVTMTALNGSVIGSMEDKSICCGPFAFTVMNPHEDIILRIDGSWFTWGYWCPLLGTVKLDITEPEGRAVGKIEKSVPSVFTFLSTPDVDNYKVFFEGTRSPEQRALLMAAALFLDFEYFNDNLNDTWWRQGCMGECHRRLFGGSGETPRQTLTEAFLGGR